MIDWAQDIHELEITCRILEDDEACVGIGSIQVQISDLDGITEEVFLEPRDLTLHTNSPLTSEIDLCILCRPYNLTDDVKIQFDLFSKQN